MKSNLLVFFLCCSCFGCHINTAFLKDLFSPSHMKQVRTEPDRVSKSRCTPRQQQQRPDARPADGAGSAPPQLPRLPTVTPAARTGPAAATTALPAGGCHGPGGPPRRPGIRATLRTPSLKDILFPCFQGCSIPSIEVSPRKILRLFFMLKGYEVYVYGVCEITSRLLCLM